MEPQTAAIILVTPELGVPIPTSMSVQEAKSLRQKAQAAFNTVEFLQAMGMDTPPPTAADHKGARSVFFETPGADTELSTSGKALVLKAMLDEYDVEVVRNAAQLRGYIKLKLLELSETGKESTQIKALELLGKLSDVQAFSDNIQVNVTHQTTEELQAALATKLSHYMSEVIDGDATRITTLPPPEVIEEELIKSAPAVDVIDINAELGDADCEQPNNSRI